MAKAPRGLIMLALTALVLFGLPSTPGMAGRSGCFGRRPTHVGDARDNVIYGTRGNDVIAANGGDDVVWSFGGTDFICGGGGSDFIDASRGRDHVDGGPGRNDAVGYRFAAGGVTVRMSTGKVSGRERDSFRKIEIVFGSQHDDRLYGSDRGDLILGNKGADLVSGLGGQDLLLGLEGNDRIDGGAGNEDTASYYTSESTVDASLMTNRGGSFHHGSDRLSNIEGLEASLQYGGTLEGDDDSNGLFTSRFDSFLYGRGGDDLLLGGDGQDNLEGDDGNDVIVGRGGNDGAAGGVGDDLLIDGGGSDGASLGEGDDEARAAPGNDLGFDGEAGTDTISFVKLKSAVVVDLGNGFADASGRDALSGFEVVHGGPFGDTLTGDGADNWIYGLDGDDTLAGAEGNDLLDGGNGTDGADGGLGLDTCTAVEDMTGCENLPPILPSPSPRVTDAPSETVSWPLLGGAGDSVGPFRGPGSSAIVLRMLRLQMRR